MNRCVRRDNSDLVFRAYVGFGGPTDSFAVRSRRNGVSNLGFLTNGAVDCMGRGTHRNALLTRARNNITGLILRTGKVATRGVNFVVCFFRGAYTISNCVLNIGPFGRPNIRDCGGGVFTLLNGPNCRDRGRELRGRLNL